MSTKYVLAPGGGNQFYSPKESKADSSADKIVYKSEVMRKLMLCVGRVAVSDVATVVVGESGTGKKLIARGIHAKSSRSDKAFLPFNCESFSGVSLESELFGHEKGAFPGAYADKPGLLEKADGGTVFLSHIGAMSLEAQLRLLSFLQEGSFYRVGGKVPVRVDVRIIAANNSSLAKGVAKQSFREDLFYRINTVTLNIPSLRKRKSDIVPLMEYFLAKSDIKSHEFVDRQYNFSSEALNALQEYSWPGNVRELRNCCDRLLVLARGKDRVELEDLPEHVLNPKSNPRMVLDDYNPTVSLYDLEQRYIIKALDYFSGNKTRAAHALGITIKTLYNKLHEYGVFEKYSVQKK